MSDGNTFAFGKFIPGFDFLQQLAGGAKGAAGPLSGIGSWVAPTVSVEELDKRIQEMKAVLFWLDQNATALKATIQALEVQKMTLATLEGMNLSMAEVAKAFTVSPPATAPAAAPSAPAAAAQWPYGQAAAAPQAMPDPEPPAAPAPEPEVEPAVEPVAEPAPPRRRAAPTQAAPQSDAAASPAAASMADPMQWWGALTQQFQQIAANALRDATAAGGQVHDASDSIASGAGATGAERPKGIKSKAANPRPAKKPAARKAPAKKAAAKAKPAKPAAAKAAAPDWPLPPPFKLGR